MGRCYWNTCSLCPYLDTQITWHDLRGLWRWHNLPADAVERKGEKKLSLPLASFCLFLCHTHTHKYEGASRGGEQAWPGRTARNTCNRLVFLMLGNKSSHPSLASLSPPSMDLIGWGPSTHNTHTKHSIRHWKHDASMDVFILSSVIIRCCACYKLNHTYIITISLLVQYHGGFPQGFRLGPISRSNIFIMTANSQGQDQSWGWLLYWLHIKLERWQTDWPIGLLLTEVF